MRGQKISMTPIKFLSEALHDINGFHAIEVIEV